RRVRSERVAYRTHELDVRARLDLELDLAIARVERGARALHECGRRLLDPDRDADIDVRTRPADQLRERRVTTLRLDRPERHLERRTSHAMTAHAVRQHRVRVTGMRELRTEQ